MYIRVCVYIYIHTCIHTYIHTQDDPDYMDMNEYLDKIRAEADEEERVEVLRELSSQSPLSLYSDFT